MKKTGLLLILAGVLSSSGLWAQKSCYVIDSRGNRIAGETLTADKDGTLSLQLEAGGPRQTFKPGTYRTAFIPKTKEIFALEQALAQNKLDFILSEASPLFVKYQYLGWGGHLSYLEGAAQIGRKNYAAALPIFERGLALNDISAKELMKGKVQALIGLKRLPEAQVMLEKLVLSVDDKTAAFAFNARARLFAEEGKKKEAVLEYLKTLLLFQPGNMTGERDEARREAVALLKAMGDPRAAEFEKYP